jgi:hypothetical protein
MTSYVIIMDAAWLMPEDEEFAASLLKKCSRLSSAQAEHTTGRVRLTKPSG